MKTYLTVSLPLLCSAMIVHLQQNPHTTSTLHSSPGPKHSTTNYLSVPGEKWIGHNISHVFKRNAALLVYQQTDLEARLRSFIDRLRTYINETGFFVERFLHEAPTLAELLERILASYADYTEVFPRGTISDSIGFAKRMFREMSEAAEQLQELSKKSGYFDYLVYCLVELNVGVLALMDNQGKPNLRLPGIRSRVSHMRVLLQRWTDQFEEWGRAPVLTRVEFLNQRSIVERRLDILSSYMVFITNR